MSKRYHRAKEQIKTNKANVDNNKPNCIPFKQFPRLAQKLPGIIQGKNYMVTASSGVGKTQFTKSVFVMNAYQWVKQHQLDNPDSKLDLKIHYFALEESTEEFMYSMICNKLYEDFNILIDPLDLLSMYEKETVSQDLLDKINSFDAYFEEFYDKVEVIDSISNPYGIYKYVRKYTQEVGTHYYYNFKTDKKKQNAITAQKYNDLKKEDKHKDYAYAFYSPNNPDEYVINIVDHISLLTPENGKDLHNAMTAMSASYGRQQITKHYNHVMVSVQQQMGSQEEQLYTIKGDKIIEKMKPTLAGLADNKTTQRDQHVVIGIFAPDRYLSDENRMYHGMDISRLKDQYRSAIILKNRIGRGSMEVPMYFNGAITTFEELPSPMEEKHYNIIKLEQNRMK